MSAFSAPRPWAGPLGSAWWAARALWNESAGFRLEYPIETVPAAGPRESLHYHVHSDRLFFDVMEPDAEGIPLQCSRIVGRTYNPAYVAWYGLMRLERFLRGLEPSGNRAFLRQVEWLVTRRVRREDGAVVWPYTFDWREGDCVLKAPWISAMAQGLAISALVRGHRLTGDPGLLDVCRAATRVFEKDVDDGGVRTLKQGRVLYEEYPGHPLPRVLDGFLFGLLGLYDLSVETGDPHVFQLFADGIEGLRHTLPFWDYRHRWSWYGSHGYLCPPHYNKLNGALLAALGRLSGEATLERYAAAWDPRRLTPLAAVEIFLVFLLTKNRCRFKHLGKRA